MRKLNLDDLKNGQPGISPDVANFLTEAAIVCLIKNGHKSGVELKVEGFFEEKIQLIWSKEPDEQIFRS